MGRLSWYPGLSVSIILACEHDTHDSKSVIPSVAVRRTKSCNEKRHVLDTFAHCEVAIETDTQITRLSEAKFSSCSPRDAALESLHNKLQGIGISIEHVALNFITVFPIYESEDELSMLTCVQESGSKQLYEKKAAATSKVKTTPTCGAKSSQYSSTRKLKQLDWLFLAVVPYQSLKCVAKASDDIEILTEEVLEIMSYENLSTPWFARAVQSFHPLVTESRQYIKVQVPPFNTHIDDLQDHHIVEPCLYLFDKPGKGVRSRSIKALSEMFAIDSSDLRSLMESVDRFHELSLAIDDIEDDSSIRRDRVCAHLKFGVSFHSLCMVVIFFSFCCSLLFVVELFSYLEVVQPTCSSYLCVFIFILM